MDEYIKNEINESFKSIHKKLDELTQGFKEDLKTLKELDEKYQKTRKPIIIQGGRIKHGI